MVEPGIGPFLFFYHGHPTFLPCDHSFDYLLGHLGKSKGPVAGVESFYWSSSFGPTVLSPSQVYCRTDSALQHAGRGFNPGGEERGLFFSLQPLGQYGFVDVFVVHGV